MLEKQKAFTPMMKAGIIGGALCTLLFVCLIGVWFFGGGPGGANEKLIQGDWEGHRGKIGIKFRNGDVVFNDIDWEGDARSASTKYRFLDKQTFEFTNIAGEKVKMRIISLTSDELILAHEKTGATIEFHRVGGKAGGKSR